MVWAMPWVCFTPLGRPDFPGVSIASSNWQRKSRAFSAIELFTFARSLKRGLPLLSFPLYLSAKAQSLIG